MSVNNNGHGQFEETMGHSRGSGEKEGGSNYVKQPVSDIIATFQKIKEEKFNNKRKNSFQNLNYPQQGEVVCINIDPASSSSPDTSLQEHTPLSSSENLEDKETEEKGGRKMSLPSLFHPLTPFPSNGSTESIEKEPKGASLPYTNTRRRHSVSHVVTQYSKHDLKHLSKLQELKLNEMNDVVDTIQKKDKATIKAKTDEKEPPKWLTGEDIHAFHNLWEKQDKLKRPNIKKMPRPSKGTDNNIDEYDTEQYERPRVFSF